MSTLYWLTVLGNLGSLTSVVFCIFAVSLCVLSLFSCFDNDWSKSNKKTFKIILIGVFVSLVLCVLIPSRNELYEIYGVGTVIDYAKDSKEVQKLPDNTVKALNVYLENIQKEDSTSTTK